MYMIVLYLCTYTRVQVKDTSLKCMYIYIYTVFIYIALNTLLVVLTHLKNMLVKLDHFPSARAENSQNLWETTT